MLQRSDDTMTTDDGKWVYCSQTPPEIGVVYGSWANYRLDHRWFRLIDGGYSAAKDDRNNFLRAVVYDEIPDGRSARILDAKGNKVADIAPDGRVTLY